MKKRVLLIVAGILALVLLQFLSVKQMSGRIVGVQDGDTVTLLEGGQEFRIRLDGIDCPEKNQAYGQVARQFTADKAFNRDVKVRWKEKDRYGRYLGTLITPRGENLNKELLKAGLAWHYKQYSDSFVLAGLERQARKERRGLWAEQDPEPPWEFRRGGKEKP